MLMYGLRRLGQAVLVLLAVSLLAFCVFRFLGDPTLGLLGEDATLEARAAARQTLGLDAPVLTQYSRYLQRLSHGDWGISYRLQRPVLDVILERLPATLELTLIATLWALLGGISLGIYTAMRPDSGLSRSILSGSLIGVSLPTFLIGIGLIYLFAVELRWLPAYGRGETVAIGAWETGLLTPSGLSALVLPGLTLGLYNMTLILRLVRSEMLQVLRTDYIRFARARGLRSRDLYLGHALRNTLLPVLTIAGLQIGGLIAFAIVTETVFQWPGMGLLFIQSIQAVDLPVIAAYLLLIGLLYVVLHLVVDLLYLLADPRLRHA